DRFALQCLLQEPFVFGARHVYRTEALQMRRGELCVEQGKSSLAQPFHKMYEAGLRSVALAREHAFAEKCSAYGDAVKPADKSSLAPGLHRMAMAALEERR